MGLLAAVCYIPLLLTHRGQVGADTKSYLYLDPGRLLGRAWSMWDPNVGLGTVPHQNIGYLWPMGPFYWANEALGVPDWFAQRLWLGSILFLAGLGVRFMLRSLGQSGPGVVAAMFTYALTPYVLTLGARISALLLPFAALGWLVGLTVRATRERSWVHPALFALAVATFGSTNATALLLVGLAPLLWLPYATFVLKEVRLRAAIAVAARIGVLSVATSAWWIAGLWCQGAFGIDVLRYTETARTVADSSSAPEIFRGLGYWYFYGDDKLGPWIEPSTTYTQSPGLLALTYALPVVGLLSATLVRWRYRSFFVGLVVMGLVVSVGAHPWEDAAPVGRGFRAFLASQAGLAMRSLPRAVPLLSLGLAALMGAAVTALGQRARRLERPAAAALVVLAVVALPPLWLGQMVSNNLQRDEDLPEYWTEAATAIDGRGRLPAGDGYASRVLEVPGSDFASYRWGNTVDPITPGLTDRPYVARELIPYGNAASADLVNALDRQMQEAILDPAAVAPLARFMGAGDIVLRGDLAYERFNLVRPRQVGALLDAAPGLGPVTGFGTDVANVADPRLPLVDEIELGADPDLPDPPAVGLFPVEGDPAIVTARPGSATVVLAGSGDGLIAAAAAGLVDGDELVRYSASFAADGGGGADALRRAAGADAPVVVTDTNRKAARRWGTVHETDGQTETAAETPLANDLSDNRLPVFPGAGTDTQTVAVHDGGITARATSYGNEISYTPEDRAAGAFDDDLSTSWYTAAFSDATGERIEATYDDLRSTDRILLRQAGRGTQNRWITQVRLRFDGGPPIERELGPDSRVGAGQWLDVGRQEFRTVSIEITATDPGRRDSYDDLAGVGFADIRLGEGDRRLTESIRPPVDVLDALGPSSRDHPLAVVLTRVRTRPTAALRSDEERNLVRDLVLPDARRFALGGSARLNPNAPDAVVDRLLGLPSAAQGGLDTASSRRLPGDLGSRSASAVDGDPATHWSPGFLGQNAEWAAYGLPRPISFDHMDLQVVADGRHTVPTRLRIVADGTTTFVDVPPIVDGGEPDAVTSVGLDLPATVTGREIKVHIDQSREVLTNDWISSAPVVMPVGIAEWGIPGIRAASAPERLDTGCRDDLMTVDGEPVGVRVTGSTAAALDGAALEVAACDEEGLALGPGTTRLRTAMRVEAGVQLDRLVLRSTAGGGPDAQAGPLVSDSDVEPVSAEVTEQGRWRSTIEVGRRDEATWLVIGQSHNAGWTASVDGQDLGDPVLVDGYSSAFRLPAGDDPVTVEVAWAPQRVVLGGLGASAVAALVCLILALRPWRWRRTARRRPGDTSPAVVTDERPEPLDLAVLVRASGAAVAWPTTITLTLIAGIVGTLAVNVVAGLALAAAAVAGCRVARARPILALGPAALLGAAATYTIVSQVRHGLSAGFQWPERFGRIHGLGYAAGLLVGLEVLVDRLRHRSHNAPEAAGDPSPPPGSDHSDVITGAPPADAER